MNFFKAKCSYGQITSKYSMRMTNIFSIESMPFIIFSAKKNGQLTFFSSFNKIKTLAYILLESIKSIVAVINK